ncbi:hypothetical protein IFM89_004806 [Coptis chinensis]|uniref:Uncharacterized protein n=1 Tax=Coptis chinensis TaxID=261450 RepID=A0A835IAY0_9MAGN|nr:hypothetical protein IFM89_004806 [Coptis chinensis]
MGQPMHGLEQANPGIRETSDMYKVILMRKRSFRLAQLLVPFFESTTEQVIPEDLLAVHSEIVRAGEAGSDADVSEDMHYDESASGVQEGSNDMSSESDPFLAPTYESEDSADDIEVNQQGERINVVLEPVNVNLLDENMSLTTTLPASRGENVEGGIASGSPQVEQEIRNGNSSSPVDNIFTSLHAECDMQDMREGVVTLDSWTLAVFAFCSTEALPTSVDTEGALDRGEGNVLVKKRSETIEQAASISVDEAASSTGCHPQTPPPVVTTVESTEDCGMDDGKVKKKPDMDKQREIPNKTCLRRRPGHASPDVTPELLQPDHNVTVEYRKYQRKYLQKKKTLKETNALSTQLGETLLTLNEYFMFSC